MSKIPTWALEKIREAREQQLTELDLSNEWNPPDEDKLTHIPPEVFDLTHLTALNLNRNAVTTLPDQIARLTNLMRLDLGSNQLSDLPEVVTRLTNLTKLYLAHNCLSKLPDSITHLSNLTSLGLYDNQFSKLSENICHLPNLIWLSLSSNQLSELPEAIAHLSHLQELRLANNRLSELPEAISRLTNLQYLALDNNHLSELPEAVARLPNLQELQLAKNPIEVPPPEILGLQGFGGKANLVRIRNYFDQLAAAEAIDHLHEAKLLIVGEGGAGKTTLARKILDPGYQLRPDEETTEGIEVFHWGFPMDDGRLFFVNIWDFGGQEIYHTTHQFFLTKRSLYALVADTRKDDTDFNYWLNVVELLSDKSPLLIVKNEKQDRHREINLRQLKGRFEGLKDSLATNLATNRGLDDVLDHLKFHLLSLPIVGAPLPRPWVQVREALEADPRNYIDCDEFRQICRENGFRREEDIMILSGYLHDLGICLHFQDDRVLRDVVILKPEWGTDAVYKVLDNHDVIRALGRFTWDDLDAIWYEPKYAGMHNALLSLMLKFGLCYQLPGTDDTFIAPQLLTENQPEYEWDEADNLQLRFTYDFMPKGILTRFIVAMHQDIATDQDGSQLVWKSGVILEHKDTRAEVIEDYDRRTIYVRIAGRRKSNLMAIVDRNLEAIHRFFHDLSYHALIPCNCIQCSTAGSEPHFFSWDVLEKAVDVGVEDLRCLKSFEQIDPRTLTHDAFAYRRKQADQPDDHLGDINITIGRDVKGDVKTAGRDYSETDQ